MRELKPCGTEAARKRHYRRGEKVDNACLKAAARAALDRKRSRAKRAEAKHQGPHVDWDARIASFKAMAAELYADEGNAA